MAIFVQWKWEETETFLVIFHFLDDFEATNLRAKLKELGQSVRYGWFVSSPRSNEHKALFSDLQTELKPYLTWAPSHVESGLLSEVLSYANRINGLKPDQRRELRALLEGSAFFFEFKGLLEGRKPRKERETGLRFLSGTNWLIERGEDGQPSKISVQLNVEYVTWLENLLKDYR